MSIRSVKMRLTRGIKALLLHAGFFGLLRRLRPNRRVAILRYHAVVEAPGNYYASPSICISKNDFERHVRYFAKKYRVLSLDEVITALHQKQPLPANAVVFTFDDGYADNYTAAKILKKYGATGTFYLTAACIDRQEPFWLFEVTYLVRFSPRQKLTLQLNGDKQEFTLGDRQQRWQVVRQLVRLIKSNNRTVRENIRSQLRIQLADSAYARKTDEVMLTWEQVREMLQDGMVIGAHTLTHLNLPNADPEDARQEIAGCKILLEEKLSTPIRHFSYPNSGPYKYYTKAVRDMVQESGYDSSVTSYAGFADTSSDLFTLHRVRTVPSLAETVAEIELGKSG